MVLIVTWAIGLSVTSCSFVCNRSERPLARSQYS
jgi:hypothetical protein